MFSFKSAAYIHAAIFRKLYVKIQTLDQRLTLKHKKLKKYLKPQFNKLNMISRLILVISYFFINAVIDIVVGKYNLLLRVERTFLKHLISLKRSEK